MIEKIGEVKIFGKGSLGGKGAGLVKINECNIPEVHKLKTLIITTSYYDRFLDLGGSFGNEELKTISTILEEFEKIPISVRSSATNEACVSADGKGSVHAGENTSFMLPNNHTDLSKRLDQLRQAIYYIYNDFIKKQNDENQEKMAIVINPIPGIYHDTLAGPIYFPLVSGVANSFFPYALKNQDPNEGFARVAFGHGYGAVLDDFPVISMATIGNPLPLNLLGNEQIFFYAIDMTKNKNLQGFELETMKKLNVRFASTEYTKLLGISKTRITFEPLIQGDQFGFKSKLMKIMQTIHDEVSSHFQIEFVFNIDFEKENEDSVIFHVVQLTQLPEMKFDTIQIPPKVRHTYLSINNLQGHGIKRGVKCAIVVSPFIYTKDLHDYVREKIKQINHMMEQKNEDYVIIVPGRLGTKNRDWGIYIEYKDVNRAVAIFEYGVDIAGRPEPLSEPEDMKGGIYGSHFLYMIQGGYNEQQKRIQTRKFGTQGTHFLTNLQSNNIIYGYIAPGKDMIDPWFFTPPDDNTAVYMLTFSDFTTIYADSINQHCVIVSGKE